ncbi:hypothetical protein [Nostoc sp.]|uniref:hypothetical protein n=1 Tax=Nostoc sp. TaxID=1180 RepID=UPI002FF8BD21
MGQNMNQYLKDILKQEEDSLNCIIIFDLGEGLPLYYSSINLDPKLDNDLFGDNDIGGALADFVNIKQVQKALDSFGKVTKSGELNYSIFKLTQAQMMVYFYKLADTTVAICFITFNKNVSLGRLVSSGRNNIEEIKKRLPNQ